LWKSKKHEVEDDILENVNHYQIIAFCCQHCAYAAADLAGGLRVQYPPEVKVVMVPCTGKLDVLQVLLAVEKGADGVMAAG
jgi:F420-non-reducing hydrogenase iron-sulfur subunit